MKKSKRTLTPKLRFAEFRGEPGWKDVPLEQIAERITTKNLDGSIARVLTNSAEHGIVDQRDYFDKDIANAGNIDGYYIVDLGDYVYNPRISSLAPVGPISRNNIDKGVMSPLYTVFRFAEENTDFYQYYFKTASWHFYLRRVSSMGARHDRMSITTGDFMAMPVPTPPAKEQQKIADCLRSLDGLIAAEGRTLEALKAHKKGLMQQLFPQPGQTQPRLRFPEFRDKGEWKEKTLGDVSQVLMCKRIFASETSSNGEVPFYKIGTLGGVPDAFISKNLFEEYKSKYNFPRIGEVLITCSGTIGKCLPYDGSEAYFQDSNIVWIDNPTLEVSNEFLLSILSNVNWSTLNSTTITRIYGPDLRALPIKFPQNDKEQQRITDCLSTLAAQIDAQAAKIDALKQHKRGLMQQLFPAPEVS